MPHRNYVSVSLHLRASSIGLPIITTTVVTSNAGVHAEKRFHFRINHLKGASPGKMECGSSVLCLLWRNYFLDNQSSTPSGFWYPPAKFLERRFLFVITINLWVFSLIFLNGILYNIEGWLQRLYDRSPF